MNCVQLTFSRRAVVQLRFMPHQSSVYNGFINTIREYEEQKLSPQQAHIFFWPLFYPRFLIPVPLFFLYFFSCFLACSFAFLSLAITVLVSSLHWLRVACSEFESCRTGVDACRPAAAGP